MARSTGEPERRFVPRRTTPRAARFDHPPPLLEDCRQSTAESSLGLRRPDGSMRGGTMTTFDRRSFMRVAAVGAGAVATGFRPAIAGATTRPVFKRATRIAPSLTQAGPELALLPGFTYKTFAAFGSPMSDGLITPPIHDGMGVFDQPGGGCRTVRNREAGG